MRSSGSQVLTLRATPVTTHLAHAHFLVELLREPAPWKHRHRTKHLCPIGAGTRAVPIRSADGAHAHERQRRRPKTKSSGSRRKHPASRSKGCPRLGQQLPKSKKEKPAKLSLGGLLKSAITYFPA